MDLPPGFRFHPTDEELITHYLRRKVAGNSFSPAVIGELDMNKCEPWDLPLRSRLGEEWYFFCIRDRKYSTGLRTNRATEAGYWKATGKDKEIHKRKILIGMRKTLVFYRGRAPNGEKTKWVMHEYRLEGNQPEKIVQNEWVICRIFCRGSDEKGLTGLMEMSTYRGEGINSSSVVVPSVGDSHSKKEFSVSEDIHVTCFSGILESQKAFEDLFTSSYNSPFLSTDDVLWSSMNPSKMALQGTLWTGQAQEGVQLFQNGDDTTIKKEGFGLSEETGMNIGLQSAISAASASCHIGGCLFDYQDGLTTSNQFLHLDGWTLNC